MSSATLEIIGGYDRRTRTGAIPSAIAHGLAQNTRKSQPRRTMNECMAIANGVIQASIIKNQGRYYISTPKLPLKTFVCGSSVSELYNELYRVRELVLAAMSDAEVADKAAEYITSF